jgi:aryl-alcohol dehydrogenase-like predicted oxidoreductase
VQYRTLGKTGIKVSEIGFGTWVIGTDMYGKLSREDWTRLIRTALDLGINVFDTADVYGDGLSEENPRGVTQGLRRICIYKGRL